MAIYRDFGSGKLIRVPGGGLASERCCCHCKYLAIIVSNSNERRDQNFEAFLNGTSLGTINNEAVSNVCTGRIFATVAGITCSNMSGDTGGFTGPINPTMFCDSGVCSFEAQVTFPKTLLIDGSNTFVLKVAPNGAGYLGNSVGKVHMFGLHDDPDNPGEFVFCKWFNFLNTAYNSEAIAIGDTVYTHTFTYP